MSKQSNLINASQDITVNSSGNVGIGTSSPFSTLSTSVGHNAPSTSGNMASNGATFHNGQGGRAVQIGVNETGAYNYIQSGYVNNADVGVDLAFFTGASERMRINGSGSVGIGTTLPTSKIHLQNASGGSGGYLKVTDAVYGGDVRFGMADGVNNDAIVGVWSNNNVKFYTNSTERMRIDGSGRVTMPYQPLANVNIHDHNTSVVHAGAGVSALNTSTAMAQGGMSVTSDRITVPVAGKYYVSARQLNQGNSGEYFNILLNGTTLGHGYNSDTAPLHDLNVDVIASMSANDYIQVSYNTATANRWEGEHSNLLIYLIG